MENLTKASHKLAELMYQAAGASVDPGADPTGGATNPGASDKAEEEGDSDVIDAEFEEDKQ